MVDKHLVRELDMYWMNDRQLYRQYLMWVVNFRRKIKRGVYRTDMAIKGIANNFVPLIARKYRKEYGLPNVSKEDKYVLAADIVKQFETENIEGNYSKLNSFDDIKL